MSYDLGRFLLLTTRDFPSTGPGFCLFSSSVNAFKTSVLSFANLISTLAAYILCFVSVEWFWYAFTRVSVSWLNSGCISWSVDLYSRDSWLSFLELSPDKSCRAVVVWWTISNNLHVKSSARSKFSKILPCSLHHQIGNCWWLLKSIGSRHRSQKRRMYLYTVLNW